MLLGRIATSDTPPRPAALRKTTTRLPWRRHPTHNPDQTTSRKWGMSVHGDNGKKKKKLRHPNTGRTLNVRPSHPSVRTGGRGSHSPALPKGRTGGAPVRAATAVPMLGRSSQGPKAGIARRCNQLRSADVTSRRGDAERGAGTGMLGSHQRSANTSPEGRDQMAAELLPVRKRPEF